MSSTFGVADAFTFRLAPHMQTTAFVFVKVLYQKAHAIIITNKQFNQRSNLFGTPRGSCGMNGFLISTLSDLFPRKNCNALANYPETSSKYKIYQETYGG